MRNFKTLIIVIATTMLFGIQIAKAQLPSTDPAYYLAWADSFPHLVPNSGLIDTAKWSQIWGWNQSDSVEKNWKGS